MKFVTQRDELLAATCIAIPPPLLIVKHLK